MRKAFTKEKHDDNIWASFMSNECNKKLRG